MQTAYKGESFVLEFDAYDSRDTDREVDSADFEITVDDKVVEMGTMQVTYDDDEHLNRLTFRFVASHEGVNTIKVKWRMGQDIMMSKHNISVEAL